GAGLAPLAAQGRPERAAAPAPTDPKALEALYRARLDSARMRFTPADVRFMSDMIHHHAQAVTMSRWAATHGASKAVQVLAGRIINAQLDDITTMTTWLRDRRQPVPAVHDMGGALMVHADGDHDGHAGHAMAGMLSDDEMRALDAARGGDFDRRFLEGMIRHHQGAVTMVDALFATDGAARDEQVFKFASDVQVDQSTEIARMELMLAAVRAAAR
ncbi:MAG: DUF305 domain-containing protein, partial [Gemmatimonadaceae bacterium]|nr:DUF305 domain-containing protein [Gemmatimonadaceae bacterium]